MFQKIDPFGYLVSGVSIGEVWLNLVEVVMKFGDKTVDEGRKRLSLQAVRIKSLTQEYPDKLVDKYADKSNIDQIIHLTFDREVMYDFDVVPSFSPGSQSYYARIKNWDMLNFVIKRLTEIPESKKAIMCFVRKEDYERCLEHPRDDYLPCITTVQFRLIKADTGYQLNTLFNARSIDVFQKSIGNMAAIVLLSKKVCNKLHENLRVPISLGLLDGMIADAHIYEETYIAANGLIERYNKHVQ